MMLGLIKIFTCFIIVWFFLLLFLQHGFYETFLNIGIKNNQPKTNDIRNLKQNNTLEDKEWKLMKSTTVTTTSATTSTTTSTTTPTATSTTTSTTTTTPTSSTTPMTTPTTTPTTTSNGTLKKSAMAVTTETNDSLKSNHRYYENKLVVNVMHIAGLGNRLFMYATGYGIAAENSRNLSILIESKSMLEEMKSKFHLSAHFVGSFKKRKYVEFWINKCCVYDDALLNLPRGNVYVGGYLQSWKYFHKYRKQIRKEFTFSDEIQMETNEYLKKIRKDKSTVFVGIHIRRGDMLAQHLQNVGYTIVTREYLIRAIDLFKSKFKNCVFIVASNDLEWSKTTFLQFKDVQYIFTPNKSAYSDLSILSSCDHMIMSTGTFSWWAAYLGNGTVTYFKNWPKNGSALATEVRHKDFFLDEWIPL